jgi:SSS family solute:Na+ symporter
MIGVGIYFSRKNKSSLEFSTASGKIPGWALGLSFYATFLSAITFLGDPGKSFSSNWNPFMFSLSIPFAAIVATKYFVPFYRNSGEISAYTHLERQFGAWARTYAMVCFILTQLARMGTIFYGIALTLNALLGISMPFVIVCLGLSIILYTVLGGMQAVIWTEVIQAIIKTLGALLMIGLIFSKINFGDILSIGSIHKKFSLGTTQFDFSTNSLWVIFLYGFFINLTNFGIDQNYIQRYHTAHNEREASQSIWLCALYYVPVSALFFFLGTSLFVFYTKHPELIEGLRIQVAQTKNIPLNELKVSDYGDQVLPFFMKTQIPKGILGIILAALLSAAMSTISSGMNSSATVFLKDIYLRYINPTISPSREMWVIHLATIGVGLLGIIFGICMIGVKSLLDVWWKLSGIFASGMLGIFLLGLLAKKMDYWKPIVSVIIGVVLVAWITFKDILPGYLWISIDTKMTVVVGTMGIIISGFLLNRIFNNSNEK